MPPWLKCACLWAAVYWLVAGTAAGQEAKGAWKSPHFSDDAAAVYQAASAAAVSPGTDVVVLTDEDNYVFDPDGKVVHTNYLVYKVLTQKGAEGWDGISMEWEPWHQQRPVVRARVITPDHVVHLLDPKTISDAPAAGQEQNVYSDGRVLRAPLPAIAPGSLVEEEEVTQEHAPLFEAGVAYRDFLSRYVPVQHALLTIDAPALLPLEFRVQLLPGVTPERNESNGRVRLVFEAGPLEPLTEVPNDLPSDFAVGSMISFSTGVSWQNLAAKYENTVDLQIALKDVQGLVNRLVAEKTTREAKVAAITQFLGREIRYTGVEFGESAIVPHPPADTLKHKYGDCKDKATLAVAMLRAAGVPAYVALLNAGQRRDVDADLPGMGVFDHAIVYAPGAPDIWIDATDEYARAGQLPAADQGRLALIAHSETKGLLRTPESASEENRLVETREFFLSEYGPARVVETTEPHGVFESEYRSYYADQDSKDNRENLKKYVESQYLAAKLSRLERSDPTDLSKPFQLSLEAGNARRGFTDLESSVVAIRLESLFDRLPAELQEREKEEKPEKDGNLEKPKPPRTADYQLPHAFVGEWRYRIVPPAGFQPKQLPQNAKIALGPAILTEDFSAANDGAVSAVLRFDTVKRRFTVAEATEMRSKVAQLSEGQPILLYFEPVAQALVNQGKIREGFQANRDLIARHPKEAVHHLQRAKALLAAGMGQAARDEAREAVRLEPNSAVAQKVLANILEYDLVGRQYRRGSDYAGAEAAYRAAKKLDADDHDIVGSLAILLEHNQDGERYGPGAQLKEAVQEYRSLKEDQLADIGLKNNLAFALFYAGDFAEAEKYAQTLNPQLIGVIVASETALKGTQAGLEEARKRAGNEADVKTILKTAGEMLMRARKYPQAAVLLETGASGDNASSTMALANMLKKAQPHEQMQTDGTATGIVKKMFLEIFNPKFGMASFESIDSRNAQKVLHETDAEELSRTLMASRTARRSLGRFGFPADIMLDVVLPSLEVNAEGNDSSGYRVTLKGPGAPKMTVFVVKEDGQYRVLDSIDRPNAVGLEVLDRLNARDLAGARILLDWLREDQHLAGGDDPLADLAFPRLWTKGKDASPEQMKVAAAAILVETKPTALTGEAILEAGSSTAKSDADKINISVALLRAYSVLGEFEKLHALASALAKQYPESKRLFFDDELALRGLKKFDEADALAQEMSKRLPGDVDVMRASVQNAVAREDYAHAHELERQMVAAGKAEASDLNGLAWHALFTGRVLEEDIESAIKSAQASQNSPGVLHTLGCAYAEVGKTKEAREVLIQAMDLLALDEPEANYWYALGRIAEQYGEHAIAIADYKKVDRPKQPIQIPDSSYRLAQMRLNALSAGAHEAR